MLISDAIKEYLATKQGSITHDTFVWYDLFLSTFCSWCTAHRLTDLDQLTAAHVSEFAADAPTPNSNTRHHRAQIVKTFLRWCHEDDEMGVRKRTVDRIQMPIQRQPDIVIFTDDEIRRLFRACDQTRYPHRNRAVLHALLDTGVRASELCYDASRPEEETGLLMENLFLDHGRSRECESYIRVMGKGRKPRTIRIGNETTLAFRKYLNRERRRTDSPFVFLSSHGQDEPLSVRALQQLLDSLGEQAGIDDVHAHRFRHTYAVSQLMAGTSDIVLMQNLGHTTLKSTQIYTRAMTQAQARSASFSVIDRMKAQRSSQTWHRNY